MFDHEDDYIEGFRRIVYPRLHKPLSALGNKIGINLYAEGHVGKNQYVGTTHAQEDKIERELDSLSAERNVIACLKTLRDGRVSEGSWVLLHEDVPELIAEGMQVHITLFKPKDGSVGREVYAHYEDDWRSAPLAHLREKNFDVAAGVAKMSVLCDKSKVLSNVE